MLMSCAVFSLGLHDSLSAFATFDWTASQKIAAEDAPTRLQQRDAIIIHVVPFSAFDKMISLPLTDVYNLYPRFPPLAGTTQHFRINLDGLLTLSNAQRNAPTRAYVQVFRSGIVEAVSSILMGDGSPEKPRRATSMQTECYIVGGTHQYIRQ